MDSATSSGNGATKAVCLNIAAHGCRKAGATIAVENGATEHELMTIFGWDSPKQAALYTRKVNRKRLAGNAMHMLVPVETEVGRRCPTV